METQFDPITLEILWNRLICVVDESDATLSRTAFSPNVRESHDHSCIVTDCNGMSLAQATLSIPSFIGTLPATVRALREYFPEHTLEPGDVLLCNDPWLGTGHLNDINMIVPLFRSRSLIGYSATTSHASDIGGRILSLDNTDLFEEGLQIPPVKLYAAGELNDIVMKFLKANVRVPLEVIGDLDAQLAANQWTERRVLELTNEYDLKDLEGLSRAIQEYSERAMRQAIRGLKSGTYTAEDRIPEIHPEVKVSLTMKVDGEQGEIVCDFGNSSAELENIACNDVITYTKAYTAFPLKSILAPYVPNNEGFFRPITVTAPEGSIFNARHPRAVGVRHWVGHHIPTVVNRALAEVIPNQVRATSGQPHWIVMVLGSRSGGDSFVMQFIQHGGMGAGVGHDGGSCLTYPSNARNTPVEVLEQLYPLKIVRRELRPDSGGVGQWRGGLGQVLEFEFTGAEGARMSIWPSYLREQVPGLHGGGAGATGLALLNGHPIDYRVRTSLKPGDRVTLYLPGGGGYGPAELRDANAMRMDLEDGLVTDERA